MMNSFGATIDVEIYVPPALWVRCIVGCFPAWSFVPALLLLMLGVVPEQTVYNELNHLGASLLLPTVSDFYWVFSPLAGVLAPAAIRPVITIWLKSAPHDLIIGTYLGSMAWFGMYITISALTELVHRRPSQFFGGLLLAI